MSALTGNPEITPMDHSIIGNHHTALPLFVARLINQVFCHHVSSHSSHQKALSSLRIHVTFTVRGCQHHEILPGPPSSSPSNKIYPQNALPVPALDYNDWLRGFAAVSEEWNGRASYRLCPNTFPLFSSQENTTALREVLGPWLIKTSSKMPLIHLLREIWDCLLWNSAFPSAALINVCLGIQWHSGKNL